ncbi:hypothetical protein [Luteolibacter soli]|uniref:Uncharacterized protein n=1 Tax=Luteolibacter soli TaxID=3135280 RepID=A0ABU9B2L4_9BACT
MRRERLGGVVRWLGGTAIVVGVGLMMFLKRNGVLSELEQENLPASYPGFLRKLVSEFPEYPIGVGVILALVALGFGYSGRFTQGLVLAFLAVGVIGGWAGVLLGALMHFVRSIAA